MTKPLIAGILAIAFTINSCAQKIDNNLKINKMKDIRQEQLITINNSKKSILARGCDPVTSLQFSKVAPSLLGKATYTPTTDDADFIKKLESQKWSVVFFAPGACRFSAVEKPIPGGNYDTKGWTLEQYRKLVYKLQGDAIKIVETLDERETVSLLKNALEIARETN